MSDIRQDDEEYQNPGDDRGPIAIVPFKPPTTGKGTSTAETHSGTSTATAKTHSGKKLPSSLIPRFLHSTAELYGLSPEFYVNAGPSFQDLVVAWAQVETFVKERASKGPQRLDELALTRLPPAVIAFGEAVLEGESLNEHLPPRDLPQAMSAWIDDIVGEEGDTLLAAPWCRAGNAGLSLLVLGIKWWKDLAGETKEWLEGCRRLRLAFNEIQKARSL